MDNPESAFQIFGSSDQAQIHKIRPVPGKKLKQKSIKK